MPTPIIYQNSHLGPLDHIPEMQRWTLRRVYYVTTRERETSIQRLDYSNTPDDKINVGLAAIGFGGPQMSWAELASASVASPRDEEVNLSIAGLFEVGSYTIDGRGTSVSSTGATHWLIDDLNRSIGTARSKELLIYVHGANVNFYNACAFAAQLDHFMGRDMTSIAFSWPTRQNILAYGFGDDVNRAYNNAPALVSVIESLASETEAKRIHIVTWSAGGRLVSQALQLLRDKHSAKTPSQLADDLRMGTVYFAAADVPADEFIERLPALNDIAERIVVTASANDDALKSSETFLRGASRIGLMNPTLTEEQRQTVRNANRLEYVNMSLGSEERGFDISGHNYWFTHPWASTDVLLSIRMGMAPEQRGLESAGEPFAWWMPSDYPERMKQLSLSLADQKPE